MIRSKFNHARGFGSATHDRGQRQCPISYLIEQRVPFAELLGKTKVSIGRGHRWPNMFRMPAYDPVAIAVMGFGILLAAALAFGL
jgi:hypothetical protein